MNPMELGNERNFSFSIRPKPMSGDMRIAWRLSVTLLMLRNSRGKRASLAKLHLLNDAIRSAHSRKKFEDLINDKLLFREWQTRVEPAFSRNLDYLVGEGFAEWLVSSARAGLKLSDKGIAAADEILKNEDVLLVERDFLSTVSKSITESFVKSVFAGGHELS